MVRTRVASTNIRSIGYYDTTLEVEFLSGGVYQYFNVPQEHYLHMIHFPHPGTYLARYVKGVYPYQRVG